MYIIEIIENIDNEEYTHYVGDKRNTYNKAEARIFDSIEDAEEILDMEKSDPKYDKPMFAGCRFEIVEI